MSDFVVSSQIKQTARRSTASLSPVTRNFVYVPIVTNKRHEGSIRVVNNSSCMMELTLCTTAQPVREQTPNCRSVYLSRGQTVTTDPIDKFEIGYHRLMPATRLEISLETHVDSQYPLGWSSKAGA